mmetsp:Transcript_17302/g.37210  ORF Transcript_17302/g.37210 Transcript_17302/m.37210 type:complete len:197 (-) Transcript_17302:194-784(-)
MAMALMQMGSKGPMRDLDYINPRPKCPSSALPPEVRRKLGLAPAASTPETSGAADHGHLYTGAANAAPKVGASGAGTDWQNPNGHAFVRRGSGVPMSQRASRKAQLERGQMPPQPMRSASLDGPRRTAAPAAAERAVSLQRVPSDAVIEENMAGSGSRPGSEGSQQRAGSRGPSNMVKERRKVSLQLPPKAPTKPR